MSYGDSDDEQDAQLQLVEGVGELQVAFCTASAALQRWGSLCGGAGVGSEDVPASLADINAFFAKHGEMPSSGKGASPFEQKLAKKVNNLKQRGSDSEKRFFA